MQSTAQKTSPARRRTPSPGRVDPSGLLVVTQDLAMARVLDRVGSLLGRRVHLMGTLDEAQRRVAAQGWAGVLVDERLADVMPAHPTVHEALWLRVVRGAGGHVRTAGTVRLLEDHDGQAEMLNDVAAALEAHMRNRILTAAEVLVSPPEDTDGAAVPVPPALLVAHHLGAMLPSENPSAETAVKLISGHEYLAKHVVRLARSEAVWSLSVDAPVSSAVSALGLVRVHQLVEIVASRHLFPLRDRTLAATAEQLWKHALGRAIAMRILAQRLHERQDLNPADAFSAGLFADAGAALLLWLTDQLDPCLMCGGSVGASIARDPSHEVLGHKLLAGWGAGPCVELAAKGHHWLTLGDEPPFGNLALAASAILDAAQIGGDPTRPDAPNPAGAALAALGIGMGERDAYATLVRNELERVLEVFSK